MPTGIFWALHEMAGRLLEAHARRMWAAPEGDTIARLQAAYLGSEGVLEAKATEDTQ
ncbi:MAG: hypothetical protein ACRED0_03630 [Gammaproteobacteria bacterium]